MPRALRIEYPGAICHVMNGDQHEPIFRDDLDRMDARREPPAKREGQE